MRFEAVKCSEKTRDKTKKDPSCVDTAGSECETVDPPCE